MAKNTTDDYLGLDIRWLAREGFIGEYQRSDTITWSRGDHVTGRIGITASKDNVRLTYTWKETEELSYRVNLETTPCNYGNVRYWFVCPSCSRRVAKLYGGKYFACRHCHNLTYESCQKHDKRISLLAKNPLLLCSRIHALCADDSLGANMKKTNEFFLVLKALDKIGL